MDPIIHTGISVFLLALSYYLGRYLGGEEAYTEGKYEGAQSLMAILEDEGTYSKIQLTAAVERWVASRLRENERDEE